MKRFVLSVSLAALGLAVVVPAFASATAKTGSIVIRHQERGCHTWSLNDGAYRTMLEMHLARGGSITITNNDPMVHKLVQLRGPSVGMQHMADHHMQRMGLRHITGRGVMNHMQSSIRVTFPNTGLYRFTTEDLGDYVDLKTSGEHNHLMLVVRVT